MSVCRAEARATLETLLKQHGEHTIALYNLALIHAEGGHYDAAVAAAQAALQAAKHAQSGDTAAVLGLLALLLSAR